MMWPESLKHGGLGAKRPVNPNTELGFSIIDFHANNDWSLLSIQPRRNDVGISYQLVVLACRSEERQNNDGSKGASAISRLAVRNMSHYSAS
jgi:hypothetical protein